MKKLTLIILIVLFSSAISQASKDSTVKNKVFSSIYVSTTPYFLNSPMLLRKTLYNDSLSSASANGSLQFGYQFTVGAKKKWTIGLDYSITGYRTGKYFVGTGYYYYDVKVTNLITQFNYHWKIEPNISLYSGIGIGIRTNKATTYIHNITTAPAMGIYKIAPTLNCTLIGTQYTYASFNHKLGMKTEIGFGTNGIIRLGFLYKI